VFTDFGKTIHIKETVGQLTLTSSEGSKNYMSEPMKKIPFGEQGWVDLYLNDFHALNITLLEIP
jgi:hypothetical protein